MNKTLKEIYGWELDKNPQTSLIKDVNEVLGKTPEELDTHDINMLIRQGFFLDLAIPKAIEMIEKNHAVGDYYEYCMLVNLSKIEAPLSKYKEKITNLIALLKKDHDHIDFESKRIEERYLDSIERLKKKIQ